MIHIDIHKKLKTYNGSDSLSIRTIFLSENITQIYGPSGAGKTTLLKMIAGIIIPEKGMIKVNDEIWLNTDENFSLPIQNRNIGFVFQDYALFPNMTAKEQLLYATKDKEYINRLLAIAQLTAFANHKPHQLSGGQQQRLAIIRALATKPALLLMDEPFSALDKKLKTDLMAQLKTLIQELKITCLLVTHHPFEDDSFATAGFEMGE